MRKDRTTPDHGDFDVFDESMRVEETKTMETEYVQSERPRLPVIQSKSTLQSDE